MAALVDYSSSDSEGEEEQQQQQSIARPTKKRKVDAEAVGELPPLPTAFHDLYSSTVRTSTQDDPSLHGGRKRVTPHTEGHWPTHVYLEWHPGSDEYERLGALIIDEQAKQRKTETGGKGAAVYSLLHNDLGVAQPLHVSLSRPLVLKTEQREPFLAQLGKAVAGSGVRAFNCEPDALRWHPNETSTRWFLVLRLRQPAEGRELRKLLDACNGVAGAFGQPLLYQEGGRQQQQQQQPQIAGKGSVDGVGGRNFHISIAWSLEEPMSTQTPAAGKQKSINDISNPEEPIPEEAAKQLDIAFSEVKVRIGQDVTTLPLPARRVKKALFA